MRLATNSALDKFRSDPSLLPGNISLDAIYTLLHFFLDNTYFEYNNTFYKQVTGGPMGSPLTVALAEIRVTDIENLAISTFPHPPKHYRHFVDDGFGHFTDRDHANNFLQHINSLTEDLQYTIEHPSSDGSIPFLDVLIHPDRSTSIYRKPTHTNLYTHYSSSSPTSTKFSIISSLTRRAYTLYSSCHLNDELQFLKHTFRTNGFPLNKINQVMDRTKKSLQKTTTKKNKTPTAKTILPFHPTYSKKIKTAMQRYDVSTTFSSPPFLMTVLNTNKTPGPKHSTCNTIYKIPCKDCNDFYIGQTCRPVIKRIKEHEACHRLNNYIDSIGNIKSAPAKHSHELDHTIDWNNTTILTVVQNRTQLNLLEHAAITVNEPPMNRQHKGPRISPLWQPILETITKDFKPTTANINL